jgi:ABC-2 type transport system ATP-binding protein
MSTEFAIETQGLRKLYGDIVAVGGLTLQVQQGEVFGFLGPNGAGKTTSIKMLLGLVAPSAGSARLLGEPLGSRPVRARIGFLPEHFRFHDWLNANEFLTLHGELYGMGKKRLLLRERIKELLDLVGLTPFEHKLLRTYSKGMIQRIGLAQALLNDPLLVFLDEPTSGLDPIGRRLVRDIIHDLRQKGATVFLNSHMLSEVEITCDRVAFIKQGEVLYTSQLKSLINGETSVTIRCSEPDFKTLSGLRQLGKNVRADGDTITLTVSEEAALPAITRYLVAQGLDIYAITPQRLSLEDLFIQVIGADGGL